MIRNTHARNGLVTTQSIFDPLQLGVQTKFAAAAATTDHERTQWTTPQDGQSAESTAYARCARDIPVRERAIQARLRKLSGHKPSRKQFIEEAIACVDGEILFRVKTTLAIRCHMEVLQAEIENVFEVLMLQGETEIESAAEEFKRLQGEQARLRIDTAIAHAEADELRRLKNEAWQFIQMEEDGDRQQRFLDGDRVGALS